MLQVELGRESRIFSLQDHISLIFDKFICNFID